MAKWWSARRILDTTCALQLGGCAVGLCAFGCSDAREAVRVELPVVVEADGMAPLRTNLGYDVTFSEARVVVQDLQFAMRGEMHAGSLLGRPRAQRKRRSLSDWLVPAAHAHPGHYQGGEITGELPGRLLLSWLPLSPEQLGMASLIAGAYHSVNFTFARGEVTDGLAADDALLGHTAILRGQAVKDGQARSFSAVIDAPEGRQLEGAPFEVEVRAGAQRTLGIELVPVDPVEGDTLFDDLEFAAMPLDVDGLVALGPGAAEPLLVDAYNVLRRALQTHDHFSVRLEDGD